MQKLKLRLAKEVEAKVKPEDLEGDQSMGDLMRQCVKALGRNLDEEELRVLKGLGSSACAYLAQRAPQ